MSQSTKTLRVVTGAEPNRYKTAEPVVLVDEDGDPIDLEGGDISIGISDVDGLEDALDDKADASDLSSLESRVTDLEEASNGDNGGDD